MLASNLSRLSASELPVECCPGETEDSGSAPLVAAYLVQNAPDVLPLHGRDCQILLSGGGIGHVGCGRFLPAVEVDQEDRVGRDCVTWRQGHRRLDDPAQFPEIAWPGVRKQEVGRLLVQAGDRLALLASGQSDLR